MLPDCSNAILKSTNSETPCLVVQLEEFVFAVSVQEVHEVLIPTPLRKTPPGFEGLTGMGSVRNLVFPVYCGRSLLLKSNPLTSTSQNLILLVSLDNAWSGLCVDAVLGIGQFPAITADLLRTLPNTVPSEAKMGVLQWNNTPLPLLSLKAWLARRVGNCVDTFDHLRGKSEAA
jgi:chemotaxis signal transduction protein